MPLKLTVRGPEDLAFKSAAEKQYLIFNLLGAGKVAWDKGDFATATAKWDSLLRVPGLPAELDSLVRPLLISARAASGQTAAELPPAAANAPVTATLAPMPTRPDRPNAKTGKPSGGASVTGQLTGGGKYGPRDSVVFLRRLDGPTPKPRPGQARMIEQKNKTFEPRVLIVPVGTPVEFKNIDPVFHNVFSPSRPNHFDLGLYRGGTSKSKTFDVPGVVQLLCHIHTSMLGWVLVVDTPWSTRADASGRFAISDVPPGEYRLSVWHEYASKLAEQTIKVGERGAEPVELSVDADKGTSNPRAR